MKVIFLTIVEINSIDDRGIYHDLLRKFRNEGHDVTIVTPVERRKSKPTSFTQHDGVSILQVKTFNIQKTNVVEKGIGTLAIEYQFLHAIKKYLSNQKFDLILYSTPPITFSKVISYIKKTDRAFAYLLLKDIFPQNAVDMKMIKEGGVIHRLFLKKERKLYEISDMIGCMSEANKEYVIKHNPYLAPTKVEVNPNTIEPISIVTDPAELSTIRQKYQLPLSKKILVYGGNLGKPQGVDFLLETIQSAKNPAAHFLIVGSGTEFSRMQDWFLKHNPSNATLLSGLPKADYDKVLAGCDIGLIFLHQDFTIPNFPSRLLSYLEMGIPVLAATDVNTDIGHVIEKADCGYWVKAGNIKEMLGAINTMVDGDLKVQSEHARQLLLDEYTVDRSYHLITDKVNV
ncbi:glycosyltransferase family 4 protein [Pedobacter sp. HDW13]|uniref:glycosyltransferase family 4 protein n=1 Tax=Pedobacter sp. HDW13 TaxID=2714940 RepID=UPI00140AFDC2|nr:glycosyltransferase family 4 protein [Pedobacter sp. HDW13]QIL39203.1 glycosyltransferase family 4 protein [Pedobacter sp. HDW13]